MPDAPDRSRARPTPAHRRGLRLAALALAICVSAALGAGASPAAAARAAVGGLAATQGCRVPRLLGLERGYAEGALAEPPAPGCVRLVIGHVSVRHLRRRARMIVVSQTPRAGTPTVGHERIRITLEPAPPLPSTCRAPAYYRLLVDTPTLIVWQIKRGERPDPLEEFTETDYACAPPKGPKRSVASSFSYLTCGGAVEQLVWGGSFVAVAESSGCQYGSSQTLGVIEVRSGRRFEVTIDGSRSGAREEEVPELAKLGAPVGFGAEQLALDPSGDVAWVGQTEAKTGPTGESVLYLHDAHGLRRVAAGPQISDVAFHGSLLTWKLDGVGASAEA